MRCLLYQLRTGQVGKPSCLSRYDDDQRRRSCVRCAIFTPPCGLVTTLALPTPCPTSALSSTTIRASQMRNHCGTRTHSTNSATTRTRWSTSGSFTASNSTRSTTLSGETYVHHTPSCHPFHVVHTAQTNTRFETAKAATVSGLPPHATAEQREERLSAFYRNWVLQEATRQEEYNSEWRRRSMQEIKLAARVSFQKVKVRFAS